MNALVCFVRIEKKRVLVETGNRSVTISPDDQGGDRFKIGDETLLLGAFGYQVADGLPDGLICLTPCC